MRRDKKYSQAEPVTDLRHIPIRECGEPLVDYMQLSSKILVARPRWQYTRVSLLRQSVAEKLALAADGLPDGYRLAVLEGWRPPYIQRRMYLASWARWKRRRPDWSDAQLRRVVNRFTAPLHGKVPPPHSTGAAFDLVLADASGTELDHCSPFEPVDPHGYPTACPGLTEEARKHRTLLCDVLVGAGLTNYPSEWWHWSWGDQGWAYRTGAPHAIYGATEPTDWAGVAEDMTDEPLVRAKADNY